MNSLCAEIGWQSLYKYGEELCGDHVEIANQGEDSTVVVLADGLGSGVKASILSTLTSKIISTMLAEAMSIEECVSTIAATLPIPSEHGVAYSTFTIIHIIDNKEADIIRYDNPPVIILRDGKSLELDNINMVVCGKKIYRSRVSLQPNDILIALSDGAVYASAGDILNYNWQRSDIIHFLENFYNKDFTAKIFTSLLIDECNRLYEEKPSDDTTICTVRMRKRNKISLMIGPPVHPEDEKDMLTSFFEEAGKHIVCGGTTSIITAKFLGKALKQQLNCIDPEIPPIAFIEGVDLVSEGVITINRVLKYAENYMKGEIVDTEWQHKQDGASQISRLLFDEATDINFYVGCAENPAARDPDALFAPSIKLRLIEQLVIRLKKMGKRIQIKYF